jgi:riboflavin kinase/FMN adenylyltransferase
VIILENFDPVPDRLRHAYLAVGNFDGVHIGHAALISRLQSNAAAAGAAAIALSFDPRPVEILRPEQAGPPLTWTARKVALLEQAGATEVALFRTGRWLLGLTAREFFDRVILEQFAARGMVEGPTFGFGRDRGGDSRLLSRWCADRGIDFEVVAPAEHDGQVISSSRIRRALAEGRVAEAARLLGRPYRVRGAVVRGSGRGEGLGFPTANLSGIDTLIPAPGVYAARTSIESDHAAIAAAVHIGPNATFGELDARLEAHLIGYAGDLYGRILFIDFLEFLRPTRAFSTVDDLVAQIKDDVARARRVE